MISWHNEKFPKDSGDMETDNKMLQMDGHQRQSYLKWASSRQNLSSGRSDKARLKSVSSATETS